MNHDLNTKLDAKDTRIAQLETELEAHAWEVSPAMAQATIDQLNEKLDAKDEEISSLRASCHSFDLQVGELQRERDDLLREAVWAMKHVRETERIFTESRSADALRAQAFLDRPEVQAFIKKEGA